MANQADTYTTEAIACGLSDVAGWLENEGGRDKHARTVRLGVERLRELGGAVPGTGRDETDALAKLASSARGAVPSIWHVVICLPGLNTDHYFALETKPSLEQIEAFWRARHPNDDRPVRPRGWNGPLRDAYPGIALIERIDVTDLTTEASR